MTGISKYLSPFGWGCRHNEEVSTRPQDILIDETNWSSPESDYGQAIGEEVINFPIYSVVRTTCLNHIPNSHLCQFILYLKVILLLDKVDMTFPPCSGNKRQYPKRLYLYAKHVTILKYSFAFLNPKISHS